MDSIRRSLGTCPQHNVLFNEWVILFWLNTYSWFEEERKIRKVFRQMQEKEKNLWFRQMLDKPWKNGGDLDRQLGGRVTVKRVSSAVSLCWYLVALWISTFIHFLVLLLVLSDTFWPRPWQRTRWEGDSQTCKLCSERSFGRRRNKTTWQPTPPKSLAALAQTIFITFNHG